MIETFIIIFGFIAFISTLKEIKSKNFIFWLFTILLIFFDGLRWEMGVDWLTYHKFFMTADVYKFQGFEPGYVLYQSTIRKFTDNYSIFLFITTAGIYLAIYYTVFKITNGSFISLFYLTSTIPWYSGSIRNMIAVAFFTLAIKAIFDKKIIKYFIFIISAVMFHTSAIIFLPMYFIYGISSPILIILFFGIFCLSFFSIYVVDFIENLSSLYGFEKSFKHHLGSSVEKSEPILGFIRKLINVSGLIFFYHILSRYKNLTKDWQHRIKFLLFLSSLSIIFYIIGTFYIKNVSSRMDIYTGILCTSILIGYFDSFLKLRKNRIILFLFVIFLAGIFYYRLEYFDLFHPYSSIFYNYDLNRKLF
jgi:hypothetical protein